MYNTAKEVTDTIYPVLAEIPKAQIDDTVSREQHIGIYRQNQQNIKAINEKLAELEKMLAPEKGKPTPNILERNKLKVNLPSKSTTWLIIMVVIIFLGLFAGIFFFVWQGQIKSSQDLIKEAAKNSFPGQKPEEKSTSPPK
jgi:cytoskeletal protein RodZ